MRGANHEEDEGEEEEEEEEEEKGYVCGSRTGRVRVKRGRAVSSRIHALSTVRAQIKLTHRPAPGAACQPTNERGERPSAMIKSLQSSPYQDPESFLFSADFSPPLLQYSTGTSATSCYTRERKYVYICDQIVHGEIKMIERYRFSSTRLRG